MTLSLSKTRQQISRSPCHAQATPLLMVINLTLKGVPNRVTYPQVQTFPFMRNYKYLLTIYTIPMQY
ncbi:hypothetical protein GmHk_17G049641 [Glycine max]|nr:hypothetical protein GmHk_17G049641 [Glycine max]